MSEIEVEGGIWRAALAAAAMAVRQSPRFSQLSVSQIWVALRDVLAENGHAGDRILTAGDLKHPDVRRGMNCINDTAFMNRLGYWVKEATPRPGVLLATTGMGEIPGVTCKHWQSVLVLELPDGTQLQLLKGFELNEVQVWEQHKLANPQLVFIGTMRNVERYIASLPAVAAAGHKLIADQSPRDLAQEGIVRAIAADLIAPHLGLPVVGAHFVGTFPRGQIPMGEVGFRPLQARATAPAGYAGYPLGEFPTAHVRPEVWGWYWYWDQDLLDERDVRVQVERIECGGHAWINFGGGNRRDLAPWSMLQRRAMAPFPRGERRTIGVDLPYDEVDP